MIRTPSQIWGAPILLGDGVWDLVSSLTLGAPVLAGAWYGLRRQPAKR